ncbi:oxygen-dependent protoporphyrinogen oxidase [Devosia enhydra]|uniref:Oxygen-dependent protoporphyrinogen oxidase n=1 Tax=Devosia enhydra TaxID=665118 RepID=A0A1K2HZY8_9HYPH|nr:FAD-dependent oxidoreductase [Devosia enhydra]SFZ85591.1 oxygen-dependent protoporphyrinogen oxidase [Devosia enhydra]
MSAGLPERVDVAIIGAGMAGLAAARALEGRSILVFEAETRAGGRLLSEPRGEYWLNFGAHMFGGPESGVGRLLTETGTEARPILGRLMGMAYGGRRLLDTPAEFYPFLLPLTPSERLAFIRMGLKLRLGSDRVARQMRSQPGESESERTARLIGIENGRTLAAYLGALPPRIRALLAAITERNGADPDEMAAGHGLRSFGNVWSRHAPGRHVLGGSALLPQRLAARLGDRLRLGVTVTGVTQAPDGVVIDYRDSTGAPGRVRARAAIVATPAFVSRRIVKDLPTPVAEGLDAIRYGAFVTAGVLTTETAPMPWDGVYATATPDRSFSVMFNMATSLREGPRRPGGSLMLFRGARGAQGLLDQPEAEIERRFGQDLVAAFPELRGRIAEITVQKWAAGAPYAAPGRARHQSALTTPFGRVALAGDYLEFPNMEAAIASGEAAAGAVTRLLDIPAGGQAPAQERG